MLNLKDPNSTLLEYWKQQLVVLFHHLLNCFACPVLSYLSGRSLSWFQYQNLEMKDPTVGQYRYYLLWAMCWNVTSRTLSWITLFTTTLLQPTQWGFLEGRSTVTSLLYIIDQWLKELESGLDILICAVFVCFFYFWKAFNFVAH